MTDYEKELVSLWRDYSREMWCAGFITVDADFAYSFAKWLQAKEPDPNE